MTINEYQTAALRTAQTDKLTANERRATHGTGGLIMAECKACGTWFSSSEPQELCPGCERALERLNGYVVPVVRCKDCKYFESPLCENEDKYDDWFCADGERKADITYNEEK